jgi:endonuclease/exonuclease/phosphatase family metal-dependent hydrolase
MIQPASRDSFWTKIKRVFNKNELSVHLLNLPRSNISRENTGLIMIQIDGFSRKQLELAIKNRKMPFLKKLIRKENYQLYSHYPGLPSSTPSVQAELFYGKKQVIPAFSFYEKSFKSVFTMYNGRDAASIEKEISKDNPGLLKNGSSYSNVFSGGADEFHFCAVSLKWFELIKNARLFKRILFLILHAVEIVSIVILMIWETLIAAIDFLTGFRFDKNIFKELKFIPTRALFCILLRELIVIGVKLDIARGLPVIHANFIGYDEQAHRRGPSSKFAHWTLKGIDGAIERIYRKALNTSRRHYDVWIYSDHGQEDAVSYWVEHKQSVASKIKEVFKELKPYFVKNHNFRGIRSQRLRYFNNSFINRFLLKNYDEKEADSKWIITAIGPTGNIYCPVELSFAQKITFAKKLVEQGKIPIVAINQINKQKILVYTEQGEFKLPDQAKEVFGRKHPFIEEIAKDFISLTQHENAGEFTICGWRKANKPYTFPVENGAHAGPGYEETNAFALLPCDVLSLRDNQAYIKTSDLRKAALNYLNQSIYKKEKTKLACPVKSSIRIMTYNVHSCIGMDGYLSAQRIARVIARYEPDIVALQELDMNKLRTGQIDQPHVIAKYLNMFYHFHPSIKIEEEKYGNAILSRFPMKLIFAGKLPVLNNRSLEQRGALWVKLNIDGVDWNVINTHLGLDGAERAAQIKALLGLQWLGHPDCVQPAVLCGDLNSLPNSKVCKHVKSVLKDTNIKKLKTWPSRHLISQIDHIFVSRDIQIEDIQTSRTDLDKIASDHLPLIADLKLF